MATDIGRAVKRLRKIVEKSRAKKESNLAAAMVEFPPKSQIRQLKEVAVSSTPFLDRLFL